MGLERCEICGFTSDRDAVLRHRKRCLGFLVRTKGKWRAIRSKTISEACHEATRRNASHIRIPDGMVLESRGNRWHFEGTDFWWKPEVSDHDRRDPADWWKNP
jgi:hypothetical protein